MGLLKALVPSVSMNIYVVGLNQLFDAEIDKSFAMGIMFQSPPHLAALLISFVLGSVYSIEVLWLCVNMLLIAYGAAVVVGASSIFLPSKFITGSTSALKSPPANAKPLINHSLPKLPKVVKVEEQVECLFRLSIAKETEIA
ncbi:hypothetical protein NC652_017960 [Populus alba x Populus x berolinensis]|nr:hypothetical protein NC652_017960 [Populus alba x Populus x berolinensis]